VKLETLLTLLREYDQLPAEIKHVILQVACTGKTVAEPVAAQLGACDFLSGWLLYLSKSIGQDYTKD